MTTYNWTSNPLFSTTTQFRTWGSVISTALSTIGMTKTSDTGQVNWATVTIPTALAQTKGYEIWRFNDAQQSTYPLFLRLDYGSNNNGINYGGLTLTVGKGSDGAGAITGVIAPAMLLGFYSTGAGGASYASSSGTGMTLYVAPGQATLGFTIERSLDSTGAGTGSGVAVIVSSNTSGGGVPYWFVYGYADPATYVNGYGPIQVPLYYSGVSLTTSSSLSKDGVVAPVFPIPLACPGVTPWISKQLLAVAPGDAGTYTASPYGTAITYKALSLLGGFTEVCPLSCLSGNGSYSFPAALYWQ